MSGPPGGGNQLFVRRPLPPGPPGGPPFPPPPGGGGLGRSLFHMMLWGAGVSLAFMGVSALFGGGRKTTVVHQHQPSAAAAAAGAPGAPARALPGGNNPALTRPIVDCAAEEETYKQCLEAQGNCTVYSKRVQECYEKGGSSKRTYI